ncbi:hypothetical protein NDU88_004054 [Pleurodeles waltl]|uniref:Uncharacterized protein n=1 Tax=Pleurodeles waltl TaxID=8319 RepID=A0AAV7M618_PLEWA|nr:hypothetical protein NDU88_004054 [Pleurodeles waltl]
MAGAQRGAPDGFPCRGDTGVLELDRVECGEWRWAAPGPWGSRETQGEKGGPGGAAPRRTRISSWPRGERSPERCLGRPVKALLGPWWGHRTRCRGRGPGAGEGPAAVPAEGD